MAGDRLDREEDFWDAAHTEAVRAPAQRFYAIREGREALYRRWCLNAGEGGDVLELGAFVGGAGFALASAGAQVTGIDISPATVARANEAAHGLGFRDGHLHFTVMDAEALEFPDEHFDVVCGTAVIHHLDLDRAIPEVERVLKPGGRFVFTEPLGHNPLINLYRRLTPGMRTPDEHPLTVADLRALEDRFENVQVSWWHLTSLAAVALHRTPLFRPVLRALEALDRRLFRMGALRRMAWYVVATGVRP